MRPNTDPREALMRRVEVQDDGCWFRHGANVRGYPVLKLHGKQVRAARLAYELFVGPLDPALTIDHLCRNTCCVNPEHLEAVTTGENIRRQRATITHCPQGHAYAEHGYRHGGRLYCRRCRRDRHMSWRERNPERWRELKNASARRVYARQRANRKDNES